VSVRRSQRSSARQAPSREQRRRLDDAQIGSIAHAQLLRENVLVAAHSLGRRALRAYGVGEALELCGLADKAERRVGTLGLVDLKRLEVARALALEPELLLLDEVAAGLDGVDVTHVPAHRRARLGIALCHESRRLFKDLTVRESLDLAAAYSRRRGARNDRLLERVHELFPLLKDRADSLAPTLSGGQQQMVAIARALMSEPRLVIFDELSLGLAPTTVDSLFEVIAQLREWGMAIMLIEQNVYRALAVADRVCVLERGRISFAGSSGELQQRERLEEAYFGVQAHRADGGPPTTDGGTNA
jgi:ABC-type branched-subunit amino acid transport system ATPase component